jgi:hypothetical protein
MWLVSVVLLFNVAVAAKDFAWTNSTFGDDGNLPYEVPYWEDLYLRQKSLTKTSEETSSLELNFIVYGNVHFYSKDIFFHMRKTPGLLPGLKEYTVSWNDFYAAFLDLTEHVAYLRQRVAELERKQKI